jgi:hypothetical protein
MNTQRVLSLERFAVDKFWPLANSRDVAAGEGRWVANLKQKRVHYRCFDVATPEGRFVVEYNGQGMGNERVLVDGQVAARGHSTWWYAPHFRFRIGSADAVLAVRFWPWLTLRWLKLIVDGRIIYSEGQAEPELSAGKLLRVPSDPLASEGIQVEARSVPVPTNIVCEKEATRITLTQRWFSWMSTMMVPFGILLDALVLGAYALMPRGDLAFVAAVLLLPGILLASWASYCLLARLVNRTKVRMTTSGLSIRHGPLPWPGNQSLPIQHVKEFSCEKHTNWDYTGDVRETYTLSAILEDRRQVELLHKIGSPVAADILEQQLIGWLTNAKQAEVTQLAA